MKIMVTLNPIICRENHHVDKEIKELMIVAPNQFDHYYYLIDG